MCFYDDFYNESYQNHLPAQPMDAVHMVNGCYPMGYSPIQQFQPYMNNIQIGYDGCCSSGLSPTQQAVATSIMKHRMESESIDHKANRRDANDILKSGLKRQEMREKADLDDKAMEKKAEIDKEKIILKEDLRLKNQNNVIVVVKNPERENRLCVQYQNASGKTIVGKPICEAKDICMHRMESYSDDKTFTAYRFIIDGKVSFYVIEDELISDMIAKHLEAKGYPISFKRNKKTETLTAVFNCLKQECDNYPAEVIPYTEGWTYYIRNGNEHYEFVVPGSQLVFKQLAEGGDLI